MTNIIHHIAAHLINELEADIVSITKCNSPEEHADYEITLSKPIADGEATTLYANQTDGSTETSIEIAPHVFIEIYS